MGGSVVLPQKADLDLFNKLRDVDTRDPEGYARHFWEAQKLVRQVPHSAVARVAMAEILLGCGHRRAGLKELATAEGLSRGEQPPVRHSLAMLFGWTGQADKAVQVYKELLADSGTRLLPGFAQNALRVALLDGDVEFARNISDLALQDGTEPSEEMVEFVRSSENEELFEVFHQHQKVVRDILSEYLTQTWVGPSVEEGQQSVSFEYAIICPRSERRRLQRKIFESLTDLYRALNKEPGLYIGKLVTVLSPMEPKPLGAIAA